MMRDRRRWSSSSVKVMMGKERMFVGVGVGSRSAKHGLRHGLADVRAQLLRRLGI
jgi:hypothetical protein